MAISVLGKYTVRIYDENHRLVDTRESSNIITTLGRERLLDIWATNYDANQGQVCGYREVDVSPTLVGGKNRRCTFQGTGHYDSYKGWLGNLTNADAIFDVDNETSTYWTGGITDDQDYSRWHSFDLGRIDETESFLVDYSGGNDTHALLGSNLSMGGHVIKDISGSPTYTYSSDYSLSQSTGTITFKTTGNIPNGSTVSVHYHWHDTDSMFPNGIVGMSLEAWPSQDYGYLSHRSFMGRGAFSTNGGSSWQANTWPWYGKPGAQVYYNRRTEGDDYFNADWFNPNYLSAERFWFWFPYVLNGPTSFRFDGSFSFAGLHIRRWKFFEPVLQPQVPSTIAIGTDNTAPTIGDTDLGTESLRKQVSVYRRVGDDTARWMTTLEADEGNDTTFYETGMFFGDRWVNSLSKGWRYFRPPTAAECASMFSRSVYTTPWSKTAGQTAELIYELTLTSP